MGIIKEKLTENKNKASKQEKKEEN